MPKPPLPKSRIKSGQRIPKSKIKPFLESATEKKYKNKTSIVPENIMETFEKMDFLKDLIDSPQTDPEFVRQFHNARKDLKRDAFSANIDRAIYQQLLDARLARIIKRDPASTRERIKIINREMIKISRAITEIESLQEKRKPHLSKAQLIKLELEKNVKIMELRKKYSNLLEEREYIAKLAKLTTKQIEELENIK